MDGPLMDLRSVLVPALLARARAAGGSVDELVRAFALPPDAEASEAVRLPLPQYYRFCEEVERVTGDPHIGLRVALEMPPGAFGAYEFFCRSAPTFRDGLVKAIAFAPLVNDLLVFSVTERSGRTSLDMRITGHPLCQGVHGNEFLVAVFVRVARRVLGRDFALERVWFAHPARVAPPPGDDLADFFGTARIDFGAGSNGIELAAGILDQPLATADSALHSFLEPQIAGQMAELTARASPRDDLERLREKIRQSLKAGAPTLERVAQMSGASSRTLQRQLEERGTTFRDLTEEVREQLARAYLDEGALPLEEVAIRLGYSDVRAFRRAHKRWTGRPPLGRRRPSSS